MGLYVVIDFLRKRGNVMDQAERTPRPRILVAEDNFLMAEVICDFVSACGMEPIGPAPTVERGLRLAQADGIDGAILDINLQGQMCFPICPILARRNVPFLFLSGYAGTDLVPSELRSVRQLEKPFDPEELEAALQDMVARRLPKSNAIGKFGRAAM